MARKALLIGVTEYGEGFTRLEAPKNDISLMQEVLESQDIGCFDTVISLPDPDFVQMRNKIENFFQDSKSEDLLLLYFSGHGETDFDGNLFLTNCQTSKCNGKLVESEAVEASFIQRQMQGSTSQQKILILDCCFSAAYGRVRANTNLREKVEIQLKTRGTAVLTSSNSIERSWEEQGKQNTYSKYTHALLSGLQTGEADLNEDDWIDVAELHKYVTNYLEDNPHNNMSPQLIIPGLTQKSSGERGF